ncbi:MAG: discoidin domain-containing protein [Bacteroidales bacterium]|jgi:hypothetical protein|nr:discoidin domain-containing protein [Bacteroidales bacterium]
MKKILTVFFVLFVSELSFVQSFYISPTGSDTTGFGSVSEPWKTIEKARDHIESNGLNDNMSEDITVYLKGGTYKISRTITFTSSDSGSNGYYVKYKNFPNETPIISGGKLVSGWTRETGTDYYKAEIPEISGFPDYFRQLYVNGIRAERARTNDVINSSKTFFWDDPATFESKDGIYVYADDIESYSNTKDIRLSWIESFKSTEIPVISILDYDDNEKIIKMKQPGFQIWADSWIGVSPTDDFFIHNAFEELDEPGEWYLNRLLDKIYYYPYSFENMSTISTYVPVVEFLLSIDGTATNQVKNIQLQGLTFEYGNWTAPRDRSIGGTQAEVDENYASEIPGQLQLDYADNIIINDCIIRHLGSGGIQVYEGCDNTLIDGNLFYDLTAAAVIFGKWLLNKSGYPDSAISYDGKISNNVVRNIGRDFLQGTGISIQTANRLKVYHNDISDITYSGIHGRIGDSALIHPNIGNIEYKYNKVSRAGEAHKWGIGDNGQIYIHGVFPASQVAENYSMYASPHINNDYYSDNYSHTITWSRNVSRFVKTLRPFYAWHSGNINVLFDNNYSDKDSPTVGNAIQTNFHFIQNNEWPSEALSIMNNSGLETSYTYLLDKIYAHENLAEGKITWASSEYNTSFTSNNGADNDWNTIWHTQPGGDGNAWWKVDLEAEYVIQRIIILPRQDMYQESARKDFEVQASNYFDFATYDVISEQNSLPWYHKTNSYSSSSNQWEKYISNPNGYRYIRLQAKNIDGTFNFAEFGVFGYSADSAQSSIPTNLIDGSSYSSDSGWQNVHLFWDGKTEPDQSDSEAFNSNSSIGWVEFDFRESKNIVSAKFLEDNGGTYQASGWKVQYWNGISFQDIFSLVPSYTLYWQEQFFNITTTKIRLYVENTNGLPAGMEFQCFEDITPPAPEEIDLIEARTYSRRSPDWFNDQYSYVYDGILGEEAGAGLIDGEEWMEFDFGETKTISRARVLEDNAGSWELGEWKIQYYNGIWQDAFPYEVSNSSAWINRDFIDVSASKVRLYVKPNAGEKIAIIEFECYGYNEN